MEDALKDGATDEEWDTSRQQLNKLIVLPLG